MKTATSKPIKKANLSDMKNAMDLIRDNGDILQRTNGKLTVLICTDSGLTESDFSIYTCSKCGAMDVQDGRWDGDDAITCGECGCTFKATV